jgi:DNA-directed RNA polymerase alpha subunit
VGRRLVLKGLSEEAWRTLHIEALNERTSISVIIEDALVIYLALKHGEAGLALKPNVKLNLRTIRPSIVEYQPQSTVQKPQPTEVTQAQTQSPMPLQEPQATDAPSFIRDNPWLTIIARKSS